MTSNEWELVNTVLWHAYELEKSEEFETWLNRLLDQSLTTVNKMVDFLDITHVEKPILKKIQSRLLTNRQQLITSKNLENYNPFSLTYEQEKKIAKKIQFPIDCITNIKDVFWITTTIFNDKTLVSGSFGKTIKIWNILGIAALKR